MGKYSRLLIYHKWEKIIINGEFCSGLDWGFAVKEGKEGNIELVNLRQRTTQQNTITAETNLNFRKPLSLFAPIQFNRIIILLSSRCFASAVDVDFRASILL